MSLVTLPPDLKFAEKLIKPFTFEISKASMIRIVLWCLFFLMTTHFLAPKLEPKLPHANAMKKSGLIPLASTPSDPRYLRLDHKKVPDNSIIWVGGSSLTIGEADTNPPVYLPALVRTHENQYLSIKMASRLLDTYTMTLDAIAREPDMLFIALNPFWMMNDKSAFFKTNLMNAGTPLWANKKDWPLIPLLSSPGNMLWALAGQHHNAIANGYDYLKALQPVKSQKAKVPNNKKTAKISYNQPLLFWITQREDKETDFTNFDSNQWQLKAMEQNDENESAFAQSLFANMLEHIKESGIPTLIYLAPTDPLLAETPAVESLRAVQRQVVKIAEEHRSENIHLIRIPFHVYDTLVFRDYLHLRESGDLPEILRREINLSIKAAQKALEQAKTGAQNQ